MKSNNETLGLIKPLEWNNNNGELMAISIIGIFWYSKGQMKRNGPKIFDNGEYHWSVWDLYTGDDPEAGKIAAQLDFEKCIHVVLTIPDAKLVASERLCHDVKEFAHWHHLNELTVAAGKTPSDSEIDFEVMAWNKIKSASPPNQPRYQHDCNECTYYGYLGKYDLYQHNHTIILRYGNDGPEYLSMSHIHEMITQLPNDHIFILAQDQIKALKT